MDGSNPLIADDAITDEARLERERMLREEGINPHELTPEEKDDLMDDMRSGKTGRLQDDDDSLSDIVTPEEKDGND
jgi:hypothetical protein